LEEEKEKSLEDEQKKMDKGDAKVERRNNDQQESLQSILSMSRSKPTSEVYTPQWLSIVSSSRIITGGDVPIPMVVEVVDLDNFSFDRKIKYIVCQSHKRIKVSIDKEIVLTS